MDIIGQMMQSHFDLEVFFIYIYNPGKKQNNYSFNYFGLCCCNKVVFSPKFDIFLSLLHSIFTIFLFYLLQRLEYIFFPFVKLTILCQPSWQISGNWRNKLKFCSLKMINIHWDIVADDQIAEFLRPCVNFETNTRLYVSCYYVDLK